MACRGASECLNRNAAWGEWIPPTPLTIQTRFGDEMRGCVGPRSGPDRGIGSSHSDYHYRTLCYKPDFRVFLFTAKKKTKKCSYLRIIISSQMTILAFRGPGRETEWVWSHIHFLFTGYLFHNYTYNQRNIVFMKSKASSPCSQEHAIRHGLSCSHHLPSSDSSFSVIQFSAAQHLHLDQLSQVVKMKKDHEIWS